MRIMIKIIIAFSLSWEMRKKKAITAGQHEEDASHPEPKADRQVESKTSIIHECCK